MVPEKQRDSAKALTLPKRRRALDPKGREYLNTLAVAYYRLGQHPKALEIFQRSLWGTQAEAAGFDLFFLATCHHQLGDASKARDEYEAAVRYLTQVGSSLSNPGWCQELTEFQAEAQAMLAESTAAPKEQARTVATQIWSSHRASSRKLNRFLRTPSNDR